MLFMTPVCPAADYDQTGQKLWPASHLLAQYMHTHAADLPLRSRGAAACELGAGLGLISILCAAHHCPVVATDHSSEVLQLLARNCALNATAHPVRCGPWGLL